MLQSDPFPLVNSAVITHNETGACFETVSTGHRLQPIMLECTALYLPVKLAVVDHRQAAQRLDGGD